MDVFFVYRSHVTDEHLSVDPMKVMYARSLVLLGVVGGGGGGEVSP